MACRGLVAENKCVEPRVEEVPHNTPSPPSPSGRHAFLLANTNKNQALRAFTTLTINCHPSLSAYTTRYSSYVSPTLFFVMIWGFGLRLIFVRSRSCYASLQCDCDIEEGLWSVYFSPDALLTILSNFEAYVRSGQVRFTIILGEWSSAFLGEGLCAVPTELRRTADGDELVLGDATSRTQVLDTVCCSVAERAFGWTLDVP